MRAILLASGYRHQFGWPPRKELHQPWMLLWMGSCVLEYRVRADDENAAQVAVALLRDRPELLFPTRRILSWYEPDPGRKVTSGLEDARVRDGRSDGGRTNHSDAGDGFEPLACLTRAMLGVDALLERCDLRVTGDDLGRKHPKACARISRQSVIVLIRYDREQRLETFAALRRNESKLRQMGPHRIAELCALANEQIPGAMLHQPGLLIGRLHGNSAYRRPCHGFADRSCIGRVILAAL